MGLAENGRQETEIVRWRMLGKWVMDWPAAAETNGAAYY